MYKQPTRHYTAAGRVVYNRPVKRFTWKDARRVLSSLPAPSIEETKDFLDCYNLINNLVDVRVGIFDDDLVKEFLTETVRSLINLIGKPKISKLLSSRLGTKVADLIELLWAVLI